MTAYIGKSNKDINFINKNTVRLDTRVEHSMTKGNNDTCVSILCHSGLRAGIQRDNNLMPKAFRFAQSGRSMV
ncbi:MAG: hypothetical protein IKY98_00430, partial [Alphaproteobacteria bacterium]|nr:hypothetical protein [Alphaproteobacteria bacterium]